MHVFLTGATGFVGTYVLPALLEAGHSVTALVRKGSEKKLNGPGSEHATMVNGSITERASLAGLMEDCDAVVHLVGIIEENANKGITFEAIHHQGTANIVEEATSAGIQTFIHMSANGARKDGVSGYQTSKWAAEEVVANAGFDHWSILRPSVIFGDPGPDRPEFASQLAATLIKPFPVIPIFGDGKYEMRPVAVEDVATAFASAVSNPAAHGKRYGVGGPESMAFIDIVDTITRAMGLDPKPKLKQPIWLARPAVKVASATGLAPISGDQFEMLIEGNTCDVTEFRTDFSLDLRPFTVESLSYIPSLL